MAGVGRGRDVFVASVASIYSTLFFIASGYLTSRLFQEKYQGIEKAVILSLVVGFLFPSIHGLAIRGYPDIAAAAAMTTAIAIAMSNPDFSRLRTVLRVGILLALAVALRRHFAYSIFSVWVVMSLVAAQRCVCALRKEDIRQLSLSHLLTLSQPLVRVFLLVLVTSLFVFALQPNVILNSISNPKGLLYSAYEAKPLVVLSELVVTVGAVNLILAVLGCAWSYLRPSVWRRDLLVYIPLITVVWLAMWLFRVRQAGFHYTTDALQTFTLVGMVLLGANLWFSRSLLRVAGLSLFLAVMVLQFVSGNISPKAGEVMTRVAGPIWPRSFYPLNRSDYDALKDVITLLRTRKDLSSNILVAAAGVDFNDSVFHEGELELFPNEKAMLSIAPAANVDRRDASSISALLAAKTVLLATPAQYSLPPAEQKNLTFVVDQLSSDTAMSRNFRKVGEYQMLYGIQLQVLKRLQPESPESAIELVQAARSQLGESIVRKEAFYVIDADSSWGNFGGAGYGFEALEYNGVKVGPGHSQLIENPFFGQVKAIVVNTSSKFCPAAQMKIYSYSSVGNGANEAASSSIRIGAQKQRIDTSNSAAPIRYIDVTVPSRSDGQPCYVELAAVRH
jgi:hypothetical protein